MKLKRFLFQVSQKTGLHELWCVSWLHPFCTPEPSQDSTAGLPFIFAADWNVLFFFLNKLISFEKGAASLWLDRTARHHTLSRSCLDFVYIITPSIFLLVRGRIRVSFADYFSLARSTCVGKEGIIGTDLCGTAFSGCWTSLLSFKIWLCIYWALSTSPGLWPSTVNSRSHNFMEDTRVIIFLKVAILC